MSGRRLLVTGAASGIGRAVALLAADRGAASIGLVDRDPRGLAEVADAVGRRATRAVPVVADLSTAEGPAEAVAAVLEATGGLDSLVSNARASGRGTLLDLTVDDWRWPSTSTFARRGSSPPRRTRRSSTRKARSS